jgi:hypothetical protein
MRGTRIQWDDVPLGRYPDAELARRLMTTRQSVCAQRNARGIPPCVGADDTLPYATAALTSLERADFSALDDALDVLLRAQNPRLTFKVSSCVRLVPGWCAEARRSRVHAGPYREGPSTTDVQREGRATAFRFQKRGSRQWTSWLEPRAARAWLIDEGWADEAERRLATLRARAGAKNVASSGETARARRSDHSDPGDQHQSNETRRNA